MDAMGLDRWDAGMDGWDWLGLDLIELGWLDEWIGTDELDWIVHNF